MSGISNEAIALALMAITIFVMVYVGTRAYQKARAKG